MRILIADDHSLFACGLKNLLEAGGMEVVASVRDGDEAVAAVGQYRPDIVLMDIRMPNCDGLVATRRITDEFPAVKVVMLTMSDEEQLLFEAVKNGASGYLLKNLEADEFLKLLSELANGETVFSPGLASRLLQEFALAPNLSANSEEEEREAALSKRQKVILGYIAQGLTYREVGAKLHISEATVKYHMNEIRDRLQLENRSQAIAYAARTYMTNKKE